MCWWGIADAKKVQAGVPDLTSHLHVWSKTIFQPVRPGKTTGNIQLHLPYYILLGPVRRLLYYPFPFGGNRNKDWQMSV